MAAAAVTSDEDLAALQPALLRRDVARVQISRENGRYIVGFNASEALDGVLAPITWSAAEFLRDPASARVKECDGETCGWLFLDTSKNHSRRWCEMKDCGNRAKARRHYKKLRQGASKERKSPTRPRGA